MKRYVSFASFVTVMLVGCAGGFDLNDPKTNLEAFVRTAGSTAPEVTTVNYINGTVLYRQPGSPLQPLCLMEGYNIATKVKADNGYLSLSREILVYRHLHTGQILDVLANPLTAQPNEVFLIHNDPVNGNLTLGDVKPTIRMGVRVAFNLDILLQYPNQLDPAKYPKYSAGSLYEADELFQYYANYDLLAHTKMPDIPYTSSWSRKSQFLPWLEMGSSPGHLYYVTGNWKCLGGLDDVADDIMKIVRQHYPKYEKAPSTDEIPNETSWSAFKKVVDGRRAKGQPDIIIPLVNVTSGNVERKNSLDGRITSTLLNAGKFRVSFNGSVYSEITGNASLHLFNLVGSAVCRVEPANDGHFKITMDINGDYFDPKYHVPMTKFDNPLTGHTNLVQPLNVHHSVDVDPTSGWPFSQSVPRYSELVVLGSDSQSAQGSHGEEWAVHLLSVFFPEDSLHKAPPSFYGTVSTFASWLPWMEMGSTQGGLVYRFALYDVK